MSDNNIDVVLVSDDRRLREIVSSSKPAAATLYCVGAAAVDARRLPRGSHYWIDLDLNLNLNGIDIPPHNRLYFYSRLEARHRRLPVGMFLPKSGASDVVTTLWADVSEGGAYADASDSAGAREGTDAAPAWILELHELDLREWCHKCVRRLPEELGYEEIAIYLHDAEQRVLTLAETNFQQCADLSIASDDQSNHLLAAVGRSGETLITDSIARTCDARGWICPSSLSGAAAVIPLVTGVDLDGVILLGKRRPGKTEIPRGELDLVAKFLSKCLNHARRHLRARREARVDRLTGLFNDRWMTESLEREIRRAQRFGGPLSLIMIDLDGLKAVNDRQGHLAGDALIRHVARRISAALRQIDSAARVGGDEFVVLLPSTDTDGAQLAARRVQHAIRSDAPVINGGFLPVSASLGVAEWEKGWDARHLLEAADKAMYAAKRAARARPRSAKTPPTLPPTSHPETAFTDMVEKHRADV